MSQEKVAIVMLTFNSVSKLGSFFDKVIESMFEQDYPHLEVIIIDNGSSDETPDHVKNACKKYGRRCRVLRMRRNYGWSGGNNRGALLAKGANYLFFVNDDIVLERQCLRKLIDTISKREDLAAVQPFIINRDGTINCGFALGFSGFPRMLQCLREHPPSKIFFVSGAALLTRTDVFFRSGMFDDALFLYHDDVDYSWRLRLMGFKVDCVADARAYHWGSASLGSGSSQYFYFLFRNNLLIIAKNSSLIWIIPRIFLMLIETIMILIYMILKKKDIKKH